jgi:hypothetical protein
MARNAFDQASRYAARLDPVGFLSWALSLPSTEFSFRGWLDTRDSPFPGEPDRTGDTVARLDDRSGTSPPWAVAVEFQTEPDPLIFGRLLGYLSHLWLNLKPDPERGSRFQVGAAVINLTGLGSASREMRWPMAGLITQVTVAERNLGREQATDTLDRIEAGLVSRCILPWVSLMAGMEGPPLADRWRRLADAEPEHRTRSEYGSLALIFATAADRRAEWEHILRGWNMKESSVVNEWLAEGRAEGRVLGRAEGLAEGRAEGRAEAILAVLEQRCGSVPGELAAAIRASTDLTNLQTWLGMALRAESLDTFRTNTGL